MLFACAALLAAATSSQASLGRVVAIGDSLASGMGLGATVAVGPTNPNPACGRTLGSYPSLAIAKLNPSTSVDVTCNGGHSGVYSDGWNGLAVPTPNPHNFQNNGAWIPRQYDALDANTEAVILGTGGNEAYFGEVAKACTGADVNVNVFYHGGTYVNTCAAYNAQPATSLAARVQNSKTLVAGVLNQIKARSPNAKIFLVGVPRVARPNGVGCMFSGFFMPQPDGPVYATWEDGLRTAMISDVNAFNAANSGSPASFVDAQAISGTTHTMCEQNWSDRWMNNWVIPNGLTDAGIELHNTPIGAEMMARAIVDSFHAAGLDTGSQATNPTNPVVSINAPANNSLTKNASTTVSFSASDNVAIANCTRTSGSSVSLVEGANTIVVDCQDHAGNHGSAQVAVTRDSTPPTITNIAPADNTNTTASSIALTYSASDSSGSPSCTPASGTLIGLSVGVNTLTINCSDAAGNPASASVVVNRGSVPVVAITAPTNGLSTTASSVNVAFTVGGGSTIPANTNCTVNGSATNSTSANAVNLVEGANTITVACSNQFGNGAPATVSVTGTPPSEVVIDSPAEGTNTTAASINVAYRVSGSSTFPPGTSCTVNGAASGDTNTNPVSLGLGSNTIEVICSGAFGAKNAVVHVNRGNPPSVTIDSPSNGTKTGSASINLAYRVDGSSTIPSGTGCTVAGNASSTPTTNSVPLIVGANVISVVCGNQFGQGGAASVTVTRGVPPVVAITAPANNTNTTSSSVNVAFSVNGAGSIPGGTNCAVNSAATASTTTNAVALNLGSNSIAVTCSNEFGASSPTAINVNRGAVPSVTITDPQSGSSTAATSINVAYRVDGVSSIPDGTTCSVNGEASTSAVTNLVSLSLGANSLTVSCVNAFGTSGPASVSVTRGNVPVVAISSPANNTNTTATSINVAYTVNGSSTIPGGTSCSINSSNSTSTANNQLPLDLGSNSITVSCTNAFGTSAPASRNVNRGVPPVVAIVAPTSGVETSAAQVNVAFTVDGNNTIPGGTTCKVGTTNTTNASTNSFPLAYGSNSIVVTCTSAFGSGNASVSVTRGDGPEVAITAPSNALKTTRPAVNVAFTVNGANSIPGATSCTVAGQATSSTSSNSVALTVGTNSIEVKCTNALGSGTRSVSVVRGIAPQIALNAPEDGFNSAPSSVDVTFTVDGSGPPTCTVNGEASGGSTSVALELGSNSITIVCSNDFGSDTTVLTVNHGPAPEVLIEAAEHTDTIAEVVEANYIVNGNHDELPAGTTCTINGSPSASPRNNSITLQLGENVVTVRCVNAFGEDSATVRVTYTPRPAPPDQPSPPAEDSLPHSLSVALSGSKSIKPASRGGMFLHAKSKRGLAVRIELDKAADVQLRIEQLGSRRSKKAKLSGRATLSLPSGASTLRLSGRSGKRALRPGRYRVTITVPGTKLRATSHTFRVKH